MATFTQLTGTANPFDGIDVGDSARPSFADLDGDGDLDAVVGSKDGTLRYYLNTGSRAAAIFTPQTGNANPFNGINVVQRSAPSFADLDGDGDQDALVGANDGTLRYYRNTGTATAPAFTEQTAANPFNGIDVGYNSLPSFADLDGDGDQDAVVASSTNAPLRYYKNTGTATAPVFIEQTGAANPVGGLLPGPSASISFGDVDGDGDLDAALGNLIGTGQLRYLENTGSRTAPIYTERTGSANPFDDYNVVNFGISGAAASLADLDGDRDADLVVGKQLGNLQTWLNPAGLNNPTGVIVTPSNGGNAVAEGGAGDSYTVVLNTQPTANVTVTLNNTNGQVSTGVTALTFTAANWNVPQTVNLTAVNDTVGEGKHTGVIQTTVSSADLLYNGLSVQPQVVSVTDNDLPTGDPQFVLSAINPFTNGSPVGPSTRTKPALADIDGDGDLDALVGNYTGNTLFFRNTGTALAPQFSQQASNFGIGDVGFRAAPALADIDGDGDLDAFVGESGGNTAFFRNTGTALDPQFTGEASSFGISDVGFDAAPALADIDSDGDLDAFVGNNNGNTLFFRNTGNAQAPQFSGEASSFGIGNVGFSAAPTFADIDGDGDLDSFIGQRAGDPLFFRNIGTAQASQFSPEANNFGMKNVDGAGFAPVSAPDFADIDGDGDLDGYVGTGAGSIFFYRNNNAPTLTSFASGVASGNASTAIPITLGQLTAQGDEADSDGTVTSFVVRSVASGTLSIGADAGSATPWAAGTNEVIDATHLAFWTPAGNTLGNVNAFSVVARDNDGGTSSTPVVAQVSVSNPAGITVTPSNGGNAVTEGGAGDSYSVVLNSQPTADVTLTLNNTNGQVTNDVTTLTFTAANWNVPQTVNLLAVNDSVGEGRHTGVIQTTVSSADLLYNGLSVQSQVVTVTDNDLPARDPQFILSTSNPLANPVGSFAKPTFADIDSDGDLDAFVGTRVSKTLFYRNDGPAQAPQFTKQVSELGLGDLSILEAAPSFADIDGDGDLDAFVGEFEGNTIFFRNTGTAQAPQFSPEASNLGIDDVGRRAATSLADIDGDGDLDAFVGNYDGNTAFFRNTGSAHAPQFSQENSSFGIDNVGSIAVPRLADIDGDGDLDALVGTISGNTVFFRNTGTTLTPQFSQEANNFGIGDVGSNAAPSFADIDGDGDLDVYVGNVDGNIFFYRNNAVATIDGTATGSATEDATTPDLTATGSLTVSDTDTGEAKFRTSVTSAAGNLGSLTITDTGAWTYSVANSAVQFLGANQTKTETFTVQSVDGTATQDITITLTGVNEAPTLTSFANAVASGNPNTAIPITLAQLVAQGDEADSDGTVTGFVVRSVASGTLSIGADAGSATPWAAGTNDVIDATRQAFWTPASGATGTLNAFTVVARDNDGGTSSTPVVAQVSVSNPAGITVTPSNGGNAVTEGGAGDSYSVALNTQPTADVTLSLNNTNGQVTTDVTTLTFTTANWNVPQTVNLAAVNDTVGEGKHTGVIQTTVSSADGLYNGLSVQPSVVSITDNDLPAGDPQFILSISNPFSNPISPAESHPRPTLVDIDGDGDRDAFVGLRDGTTLFLRNTGTALAPQFTPEAGNFGIGNVGLYAGPAVVPGNIGRFAAPAFADIDGDGDLDAFVGERFGNTVFFRNTGTALAPQFSQEANNFGIGNAVSAASPSLVDIDGDGDLDAFVGNLDGNTLFYRNTGSAQAPQFTEEASSFGIGDVGSYATPTFADVDGDGDLDAFVGNRAGATVFFRNTGTALAPQFSQQTSNFGIQALGNWVAPSFADTDSDGDLDAFVGNSGGDILFYRNNTAPTFSNFGNVVADGATNTVTPITLAQLTAQGDEADRDGTVTGFVVRSVASGTLSIGADVGSATPWAAGTNEVIDATRLAFWTPASNASGSLNAFSVVAQDNDGATSSTPVVAQVSVIIPPGITVTPSNGGNAVTEGGAGDSYTVVLNTQPTADVTLTLNNTNGQVTTDVTTLIFTAANWNVPQTVNLAAVNDTVGEGKHTGVIQTTVSSADPDYNGRSVPAQVVTVTDNDLPARDPQFVFATFNPFTNGSSVGRYAKPTFADIDGDGDLDAFVGNNLGDTLFFRNTGTAQIPQFSGEASNFGIGNVVFRAAPALADIDGDGDLDAYVGNGFGNVFFYRNTGNAQDPQFDFSAFNPFTNGSSIVGSAKPTLADIDGDGDLDAFVGNGIGDTLFFRNTGTAQTPQFSQQASNFGIGNLVSRAAPAVADIDGDGDLDAYVGNGFGNVFFYRNTGNAQDPQFDFSAFNPFTNGINTLVNDATPALADIDGDGDLDALVGNITGNTSFYRNNSAATISGTATGSATEDASTPNLTATGSLTVSDTDTGEAKFNTSVTGADRNLGSLSITDTGTWTYNVANSAVQSLGANQTKTETFTVQSFDGTASQDIVITLNGVNDVPTAVNDTAITDEEVAVTLNVLTNDSDPDSDPLSLASFTDPQHGTVTRNDNGTPADLTDDRLTYTPTANFNGTDSFTYTVSDGQGGSATATVGLTINSVNDAPTAVDDTAITNEDVSLTLNVLVNDTDPNGDPLSLASFTNPLNGSIARDDNGTPADLTDDRLTYTPTANFNGTDSFTYTVSDGKGGTATATVGLTVNSVNDTATIGGTATGSATEDTANPTLTAAGSLTVSDVDSGEAKFKTTVSSAVGNLGSLSITETGDWTYSVANDAVQFLGAGVTQTETFTVQSVDGTASQYIVITLTGVNDAASIGGDLTGTVTEDVIAVDSNVTGKLDIIDPDAGEASSFALTVTPAAGVLGQLLILSDSGHWGYGVAQEALQFLGAGVTQTETFTVTSQDGTASEDLVITLVGVNDAAAIDGITAGAVTEDTANPTLTATGTLRVQDVDTGEAKFKTTVTNATGNLGSLAITDTGAWTYNVANSAVQNLGAGATKTETFTVQSADGTASQDISITVRGVNDTATISGTATGSVTEDAANPTLTATGSLTVNDVDSGEAKFKTTVNSAVGNLGSLSITDTGAWTYNVANSAVQSLGVNQTKTETFTVQSFDGTASQNVSITVRGINDTATISGTATGAVTEGVATPTLTATGALTVSDVDSGEAKFKTTVSSAVGNLGSLSITDTGAWTYSVANSAVQFLGANQTKTETFTVQSLDGTASQAIQVTINGIDTAPVAGADTFRTAALTPIIIPVTQLLANDRDPDGGAGLRVTGISGATLGVAVFSNNGTPANSADDFVVFAPTGSGTGGFKYTLSDGTKTTLGTANVLIGTQQKGGSGNDTLTGNGGHDVMAGGLGNDTLLGLEGNDFLSGDAGNDLLVGGAGADILLGGLGTDTFRFSAGDSLLAGRDQIAGLQIGIDRIDGPNAVSAAALLERGAVSALTEAGIGAVLTAGTFAANGAATFSFGGTNYLALNDGVAGFQAGSDAVIELVGVSSASLTQLAVV